MKLFVAIFSLYLALGFSILRADDAIRGYWRFDDGVGSKATDSSGNGNHGKLQSARWAEAVHNSGLQIHAGGWVDCGKDESLNISDAISIDAWLKPWKPRYPEQPTVLRKQGAYALHLGPSKAISLTLWLDGKEERVSADLTEWPAGDWRYFAGTYDGEVMKIYINGKLANEKKIGGGKSISQSKSSIYMGSERKRRVYAGTVDEIRLASRAFTADEIKETFQTGMTDVARRSNKFTSFYKKFGKRKAKELVAGTLWVDTEDFDDYGGWWMDTQFVPQMGSPFLMAAGIGKPVANAKTTVSVSESGTYRLWVRSKNWLGEGYAPGQFYVYVDGKKSETVFGAAEQRAWVWDNGGTFELDGDTIIELEDATGYYGRCDAIILTKDMDFTPKQEQKDYKEMRNSLVGTPPAKDMGHFDFIVVGGGVAGCNAAIAAARGGAKVALIQDRPMVGGNNSSEMGVPVSGGSSCGKGRETGLNEEIGRIAAYNYYIKWAHGAEQVLAAEPNVTVFLNTHIYKAETDENKRITSVSGFNMLDGQITRYTGDYFADCTGDGWLGYYAGAEVMLGRESKEMFGEKNAKHIADNITMSGSLMQNSILGYKAIDMGEPTAFDGPVWLYDLRANEEGYLKRPAYEQGFRAGNWWTENHGRNDDLWDPEWARDDLLRVSLSYYNWIKNYSTLKEKAANYQLSDIPVTNAKRETRRLVGDIVLTEGHLLDRTVFPDRVGYTVWKLDVHHPLGIFSSGSPFDYETNIDPASFPLRMLYSKDVPNMFMAGRHVSVTHVALGSVRVQGTTGMMGQIVGTAAAMCVKEEVMPRGIYESHIEELQQQLMKDDITILHLTNKDENDLARNSQVTASSSQSQELGPQNATNGIVRPLDSNMQMWMDTDKIPKNMWVSATSESMPQWLMLDFGEEKEVNSVYLTFDTDLETGPYVTWEYKPEERMPPECVKDYQVQYHNGTDWVTVAEAKNNYMRRRIHKFDSVKTSKLRVLIDKTNGDSSARIYEIRAYNE